ncbi:MAG: hypothetical protein IKM77_06080 [Prevotella sp.]|nr:hypothetical protein [Prevotella sp.]
MTEDKNRKKFELTKADKRQLHQHRTARAEVLVNIAGETFLPLCLEISESICNFAP